MEEVKPGVTIIPPAYLLIPFLLPFASSAQRPSVRYQASLARGTLEPRVKAFVEGCLQRSPLPKPIGLYSQGTWFVTHDLASHVRQDGSNDDGTARVWELNGRPRAVSMWIHDDEFDRNTLACLNERETVTSQINEYMPGLSEPDLHYIYVHTFTRTNTGRERTTGRYLSWDRHPIAAPALTSEDRDFIAGERHYVRWKDFDLASAFERSEQ